MGAEHLKEFQSLKHEDEMRYMLLLRDVKGMLKERKEEPFMKRLKRRWMKKNRKIQASAWK
ncbi:hypothetical protein SAMN04487969_12314 [Paenibacillus algorifonticola]|uniref:Uncharacterized protein n=1 Tax=Paenibacillus algorifonticola TaxID=684063 RepID=A0A1I2HFW1_9BACL|nr:hypothetical protein SAMN04487969_12314 [Paenibacillus algorifonticola]